MTKIGAYPVENQTMEQRMRFHNPEYTFPKNFMPARNGASFIDIPEYKVAALKDGDQDTIDMVREEFYKKGLRGSFQVRAARGGVGAGRHFSIKTGLRLGTIQTQGRGFELIMRELII